MKNEPAQLELFDPYDDALTFGEWIESLPLDPADFPGPRVADPGPDFGSTDSAPSERPKRYDHQRKREHDEWDPDEVSINGRRTPEAHGDVLFGPRVARVQDQEQPDQTEKRGDKQPEEAGRNLHDGECTSVSLLPGQSPRRASQVPGRARPMKEAAFLAFSASDPPPGIREKNCVEGSESGKGTA